ncbi:APC family permease [Klebsiella indica]|uniref:APC family permease n=1 Tax=Klebsiella indica TaxID=2582917 RepID=A0A5R9L8Z1_9ENTR|nr:APC family permease [Klebsiella indica]TLV04982.1 APC family permease [Klebsiella indica]
MDNHSGLRKNSLGLGALIFFVVAAASPLTGVVGGLPVAIFAGNGGGIPVIYILAGIILMIFSVGFIAMSRYVTNSGAFYTYISMGLGKNAGASASLVALIAYFAIQIAVIAMLGLFASLFVSEHFSAEIPWWILSIIFIVVGWVLGIRRVEFGSKILGVLMLAEVGVILCLDVAILIKHSGSLSFQSFNPDVFLNGNIGIAFIFSIASFIGFESTAIYGEECRDAEKTVPRATICALLIITVFFTLTSWSIVQSYNLQDIEKVAAQDPGNFIFNISREYLGAWSVDVMSLLLITSLFAASLAFHNNISRYIYSSSRDGLFLSVLGKTHAEHGTPHNASHVQSVLLIVFFAISGVAGLDPVTQIFSQGSALATLAILVLQTGVSAAVIFFFRRQEQHSAAMWKVFWMPLLAFILMLVTIALVVKNLHQLSGSQSIVTDFLPLAIIVSMIFGYGLSIRRGLVKKNTVNI